VIVAVPLPTAVTVNGALEEPAAIVTGVCTVATAGLLLVRVTLAPPAGAAASVTLPWVVDPATMVDVLSVTQVMVPPLFDGVAGEAEPEQ